MMGRRVAFVFIGGGLGACCRSLVVQGLPAWTAPFPLAVLLVNLVGCFLIGTVFVLADEVGFMRAEVRLLVAVGILGGFTTFSAFAWGADLLSSRHLALAALYVGASTVGGPLATVGGILAGRELVTLLERAARGILARLEGNRRGEADLGPVEMGDREKPA